MKNTFKKREANQAFDHQSKIVELFAQMGFNDIEIKTSTTNGISHYVNVYDFTVVNENRLYAEMFVFEGKTDITVRISDHQSNLDTVCNGVSGNKMNLTAFKNLIKNGAITPKIK